jgi:hypothetical protein
VRFRVQFGRTPPAACSFILLWANDEGFRRPQRGNHLFFSSIISRTGFGLVVKFSIAAIVSAQAAAAFRMTAMGLLNVG